MNDILKFTE